MLSAIKETVSTNSYLVADISPRLLPMLSALKVTVSIDCRRIATSPRLLPMLSAIKQKVSTDCRRIATSPRLLPMLSAIKETVSTDYSSVADTSPRLLDAVCN